MSARIDLGAPPVSFAGALGDYAFHARAETCARCTAALIRQDPDAGCSEGVRLAHRAGHALTGRDQLEPTRVHAVMTVERGDELVTVIVGGVEHEGSPAIPADENHGGTPAVKSVVVFREARVAKGGHVIELTTEEQERAVRALEESGR